MTKDQEQRGRPAWKRKHHEPSSFFFVCRHRRKQAGGSGGYMIGGLERKAQRDFVVFLCSAKNANTVRDFLFNKQGKEDSRSVFLSDSQLLSIGRFQHPRLRSSFTSSQNSVPILNFSLLTPPFPIHTSKKKKKNRQADPIR